MAAPAFPDVQPSRGSGADVASRLRKAQFGDGYAQRAPDGLNHLEKTYEFVLEAAPAADLEAVTDFLEARAGHEPFTFQPRGYDAAVRWVCETWSEPRWISATHGNLRATFTRDYSP